MNAIADRFSGQGVGSIFLYTHEAHPGEYYPQGDQTLTFKLEGDLLVDQETGSIWDISRGLAKEGPLVGEGLQPVPSLSSYDWAFRDFYPQGEFYQP